MRVTLSFYRKFSVLVSIIRFIIRLLLWFGWSWTKQLWTKSHKKKLNSRVAKWESSHSVVYRKQSFAKNTSWIHKYNRRKLFELFKAWIIVVQKTTNYHTYNASLWSLFFGDFAPFFRLWQHRGVKLNAKQLHSPIIYGVWRWCWWDFVIGA